MGVVYGKNTNRAEDEKEKGIDFKKIDARVDHIYVDGLNRTKDDIIHKICHNLFKVTNFEEMLQLAQTTKSRLESFGCFHNIVIHIDTSSGPQSTPDYGYDITFKVRELRPLAGGVDTMVGLNNEALIKARLNAPNVLGRGERIEGHLSYGSKQSKGLNLTLSKPLLLSKYFASCQTEQPVASSEPIEPYTSAFSVSATMFTDVQDWPLSKFKLGESGLMLDFTYNSSKYLRNCFEWEGSIRDVMVGNRYAAFEVRENAGSTLKSSARHIIEYDTRRSLSKVLPSSGLLARITSEYAGLGGNIGFFKSNGLFQVDVPILADIVVQGTLCGGYMVPLHTDNKSVAICDNFFLGGPVTFRGFDFRGAGPNIDGSFLGAKMFWNAGLSVFSPLPFRPKLGGFGDNFRTHFFANVGNIGTFNIADKADLMATARLAYGVGLAMRIGQIARLELNYCFPTWVREGDRAIHGIQVGIGTSL